MSEKNDKTKQIGQKTVQFLAVSGLSADLEHGSQEERPDWIDREKIFRFLKLNWAILVKF